MHLYFYVLSSLPALAVNFGFGNVPVRYFAIPLMIFFTRVRVIDFLLILAGILHLGYALLFSPFRPFSLLDFSYFLSYFYVFLGVAVVRRNKRALEIFVIVFWLANVGYALYQNIALGFGVSQEYVLFHQNTHDVNYVIPRVELFPFLYRVTGFFVESAPFVLYLMITHLAFSIMKVQAVFRWVNLAVVFLAGAKVGYLFILLLLFSSIASRFRVKLFKFLLLGVTLVMFFSSAILDFILSINSFGSLWVRLDSFSDVIHVFLNSFLGSVFGYGFVSSAQLMSGDFEGPNRGIDFFSTYIYSNGLLGSIILLLPAFVWFFMNAVNLTLRQQNLLVLVVFLALLTMGSLLNFQYSYIALLLVFSSEFKGAVKQNCVDMEAKC